MNVVFYIIIFISGTFFGSFYATTIKRMMKEKNMLSIHSYCENCGEKLKFFEKIPIFSYILNKGKCKHCNEKIDSIYIILEIITGFLFLLTAFGLKLSIIHVNINNLISFVFLVLYYTFIIFTIGRDFKNKKMSPSVIAYGVIISLIYIFYLLYTKSTTIYINTIYLVIIVLLLVVNILNTKKRAQSSYIIDLLTMILIMLIFTEEHICILTINGTLLAIALYILINKLKNKRQKNKLKYSQNIKIAFILGTLNILIFLTLLNIYA